MPRIKLIQTKDDLAPEHAALFDELAALRGRVSGPSSVMLHSPGLAKPWNDISEYLHRASIVEPEHAELAVLCAARHYDCDYIWNAHLPNARKAGVSETAIDAVRLRGSVDGLPAAEVAIVTFARQLLHDDRVDDEVFAPLLAAHGDRWMLELSLWIGRYSALAGLLNAFEVAPAAGAEALPVLPPPSRRSPVRWPHEKQRIDGITTREGMPEADRRTFDNLAEGRGYVRGPFALLMHVPPLCDAIFDVSNYLRFEGALTPRLRELAVIATALEMNSPYVWAAHAPPARAAGVPDETVAVIRDRSALDALSAEDRDIVEYVRQLLQAHRVEQTLFDRLTADHGTKWLVELTALIGHYVLTCYMLSAVEVSPAPDAERLPL